MAAIHIGTSGWHYKHWVGTFYPARTPGSKMFAFYCERFNTVELNNTFYCLPKAAGLENWRESSPANFCFAAKGSRFITHMKKLKDPEPALAKYFDAIEKLHEKLGPILFQLPPGWTFDAERLEIFLNALPKHHRYAFEFRNQTWDNPQAYGLLERHQAAYCIFDLAGYQSPLQITADFSYIRLHGPGGKYQGSYSEEALDGWKKRIEGWSRDLKAVYVYFDNDDSGYAAFNALRLKEMLGV
ncbi:MAG: DUF72 domain-containing protein [Acidobacteriaceae bacterium]|nr:DUF72 domain-containing protein [Acidobacteriaceae bacterium]